eukprot:CAMPEP_0179302954 /NCGR_PEP_ID=MMETSP0797-20121207/48331_1 /TAXON_ID=47934 /ORGANISM="Dinophysis acuminata, Strain DAEP01" /LENGTH=71 /DNA_ID=CAMNT_0021012501 /DNA_START=378 /DNA_END=593 /DNA_ORIENTATION=-
MSPACGKVFYVLWWIHAAAIRGRLLRRLRPVAVVVAHGLPVLWGAADADLLRAPGVSQPQLLAMALPIGGG